MVGFVQQRIGREPLHPLIRVSKAVTLLCDFLFILLFFVAYLLDLANGPGAGKTMDYVLWKLLPVVLLINLMYLASRIIVRIERPPQKTK
jgi:hypothetical protein